MKIENYLLIKGDVVGIQRYIFSVQSKGAARLMKQRSEEVKSLTENISNELAHQLNAKQAVGGGNFFLTAVQPPDLENTLNALRNKYETKTRINHLNIILSAIKVSEKEYLASDFNIRSLLEKQAGKDKLQQGKFVQGFFEPYDFPENLSHENENLPDIPLWDDCREKLIDETTKKEKPHKDKGIVDFDELANFTWQRTGSGLLAALKLDVDSLGECFKKLKTKEESEKLSSELKNFFEKKVKLFRNYLSFLNGKHRYKDNIYLVFAGGDDTFIIGGFDALLEFTKEIHEKFEDFSRDLKNEIQINKQLTFSASLAIFKPSFPMLNLAEKVEEELEQAKNSNPEKNRISVLGEIFTWNEFDSLLKIAEQLFNLVQNKKESKALVNRIKDSHKGYSAALRNAPEGKLDVPRVWRLFYYLRNVKKENKEEIEVLIKQYENLIMDAFMKNQKGNPMIFPVAARLTEYKLKNYKS